MFGRGSSVHRAVPKKASPLMKDNHMFYGPKTKKKCLALRDVRSLELHSILLLPLSHPLSTLHASYRTPLHRQRRKHMSYVIPLSHPLSTLDASYRVSLFNPQAAKGASHIILPLSLPLSTLHASYRTPLCRQRRTHMSYVILLSHPLCTLHAATTHPILPSCIPHAPLMHPSCQPTCTARMTHGRGTPMACTAWGWGGRGMGMHRSHDPC